MKNISIIGSTGSIGTQALDVVREGDFAVCALAAGRNAALLEQQARAVRPQYAVLADEKEAKKLKTALADTSVRVMGGEDAVCAAAALEQADLILNAAVGIAGLRPTLAAIETGKTLALANKESLVCGGELVMARAKARETEILPVDSEHSAIFQALRCGQQREVSRLILTASGGPFFGKTQDEMKYVTPEQALDLKAMSYPFSVRTDAKFVDIGIFKEIAAGRGTAEGGVYFDVTHVSREELERRAPITYHTLLRAGLDCAQEPIQVTMAVQNFNGGILIDPQGFTGVEGLYAAGEVTGGVHGSDRPGGNNLTDTQVFGYRAGRAAAQFAASAAPAYPNRAEYHAPLTPTGEEQAILEESRRLYYQKLTVVRTRQGLEEVLAFTDAHLKPGISAPLRNRLLLGRLFAMAELARTESRGTHYREDCPDTEPDWRRRLVFRRGAGGMPELCPEEIEET